MRRNNLRKNTSKPRQVEKPRLGLSSSERPLPQTEDAGNGLRYIQVGKFFGVWIRPPTSSRPQRLVSQQKVLVKIK
jgi:hypothetical protein